MGHDENKGKEKISIKTSLTRQLKIYHFIHSLPWRNIRNLLTIERNVNITTYKS